MPSVLFASNHCYLDFACGAALAVRDLMMSLAQRGWDAHVLSGSLLDTKTLTIEKIFKTRALPVQSRKYENEARQYSLHDLRDAGVDVRIYEPPTWSNPVTLQEGYAFLQCLDVMMRERRPNVMICFGGGWVGRGMLAVARRHGVPAVFWLRNTEYQAADLFERVAGAIVPSRFTAEHYKKKLGIDCTVIPSLVLPERVLCAQRQPRFVTYVAPSLNKGVFYFARIASELGRLRPDILILIALGRGNLSVLDQTGLNLRGLPNLKIIPATSDPRQYYQVSRAILAPVLWEETFMRSAVEGMFNGIPTLASRRGGLPDTLGNCGFVFDIASRHTTKSRTVPTVAEVKPWIDTIQRLWDDTAFETAQQEKCLAEARRFNTEQIITAHENYLTSIAARPAAKPSAHPLAVDLAFLQRFFKTPMNLERF